MSGSRKSDSNVDRDMERMKLFSQDIGKTVKTAAAELAKCQRDKEAGARVMRSHAAMVKVARDLVEMVQEYDKRLKQHAKLLTTYNAVFRDLVPLFEELQRVNFSVQSTGKDSSLNQSDVIAAVKYLDLEFRKLRGALGSGPTGRRIDDYLESEHAAYTAMALRDNARAPPPVIPVPSPARAAPADKPARSRRTSSKPVAPRSRKERAAPPTNAPRPRFE